MDTIEGLAINFAENYSKQYNWNRLKCYKATFETYRTMAIFFYLVVNKVSPNNKSFIF